MLWRLITPAPPWMTSAVFPAGTVLIEVMIDKPAAKEISRFYPGWISHDNRDSGRQP
jgi:hypothetical protein